MSRLVSEFTSVAKGSLLFYLRTTKAHEISKMAPSIRTRLMFALVATIGLTVVILMCSKQFLYATTTDLANFIDPQKLLGEKLRNVSSQFGYVVAIDFSDQMTGAAINVRSLQCWAGGVSDRLMVVEPFVIRGSSFGVNLNRSWSGQKVKDTEGDINKLRLQDVYNLESWKKQNKGRNYAPLTTWKSLLESAPKNLIVVGKPCERRKIVHCNNDFFKSTSIFANEHHFNIVRSIQLEKKLYSFSKFRDLIYGGYKPNQSVVLLHHWGGLEAKPKSYRIALSGNTPCARELLYNFLLENSPKIVDDSKRYLDQYMAKVDYVSVMLRTELVLLYHNSGEGMLQEQKLSLIRKCVKGIVNQVRNMQKLHNTTRVFLTVDCQKHGTNAFRNTHNSRYMRKDFVNATMKILFRELKRYGLVLSFEEWEASFDEVASFQAPGYVALVQKNLAASGSCLVTAGGGSFQKSAVELYKSMHNSKKIVSQCYAHVREC